MRLADITDFLAEEIKGPGKFTSRTGESSRFEEPAMNQLINDVFGDTHITIDCKAGECLRRRDVPGFVVRSMFTHEHGSKTDDFACCSARPNQIAESASSSASAWSSVSFS